MDRRERARDLQAAIKVALDGLQADIWTALPGILQSFDATKVTAVIQPSVKAQIQVQDGSWSSVTLPLCLDCPVLFPGGGGFQLTFPLAKGDEGLLVFASRCINAWWAQGGVQPQEELRMHDLSDGFFLPGVFSQPRKPSPISTTKAELRSADGSLRLSLAPGGVLEIVAPGAVHLTGDLHVTGAVIGGFGGADQIGLETHTHPANGDPPTPGT